MRNYELINPDNVGQELKSLENSSNYISKEELSKIKKALIIKKMLLTSGFETHHYKKRSKVDNSQSDFNYVFSVEKSTYKLGDSSNSFYDCVFRVWNWLLRSGEVRGELV
mgnify:CR=1 FL=1|tara:strand:- start:872 stop:1201 length:330 start_codon:yes stop_codon:yes gene_type:complete